MPNSFSVDEQLSSKNMLKLHGMIGWLLDSYYRATGLEVIFIDAEDKIYSPEFTPEGYFFQFCQLIQRSRKGKKRCLEVFRHSALKANEYGFPYIYQCHAGLVEWSAPFYCKGELLGCFISGGVLMRKPDSYFLKQIERTEEDLKIKESHLQKTLSEIKIVSEEKVKAAADILYIMASYLAKNELLDIRLRQERYVQQARISEEIHMIKRKELALLEKEEKDENTFLSLHSLYPLETERELLRRVRLGDKEGAKEVLNEILGEILFKNAGQI